MEIAHTVQQRGCAIFGHTGLTTGKAKQGEGNACETGSGGSRVHWCSLYGVAVSGVLGKVWSTPTNSATVDGNGSRGSEYEGRSVEGGCCRVVYNFIRLKMGSGIARITVMMIHQYPGV